MAALILPPIEGASRALGVQLKMIGAHVQVDQRRDVQ